MREIKFRAWHEVSNKMIPPSTLQQMVSQKLCNMTEEELHDNVAFMQYTGLKDKNGVEVYEGDIVREAIDVSEVRFNTQDVASCGCCFERFVGSGFYAKEINISNSEVIGNIYENPEILESEANANP